jgi:hypothetical protein
MGRIEEAERMMTHRLSVVLKNAELGEAVDDAAIGAFLRRAFKLALATKKAEWLGWMFDYARVLNYELAPPLLDELCSELAAQKPPIAEKLVAYLDGLAAPTLRQRLEPLVGACQPGAESQSGATASPSGKSCGPEIPAN